MANAKVPRPVGSRSYSPRIDVHEEVRLVDQNDAAYDVVLQDLSREGFRIRCDGVPVRPGIAKLTSERYGEIPVEVRWIRGGEAGGIFLDSAPDIR